jgi:polyisoprenoid-binding protein YceI
MKKNILLVSVLLLFTAGAFAQTWTVDKAHAKLGFSITHLMISDGGFVQNVRSHDHIGQR